MNKNFLSQLFCGLALCFNLSCQIFIIHAQTPTFSAILGQASMPDTLLGVNAPHYMDVLSNGNIVVLNASEQNAIQVYDATGLFLYSFGELGTGDGQLTAFTIAGLAVDHMDRIIVGDWAENRIQVFNAQGAFLFKFGTTGIKAGQFNDIVAITTDQIGNIYVIDLNNGSGQVQVFDSTGAYLFRVGDKETKSQQLSFPTALTVSPNHQLLIADFNSKTIKVFDVLSGEFLFEFDGKSNGGEALNLVSSIRVNQSGHIFVAEGFVGIDIIKIFDAQGQFLSSFSLRSIDKENSLNTYAFDLVFLPSQDIVVSDPSGYLLFFDSTYQFKKKITGLNFAPSHFRTPRAVTINSQHQILVTDRLNNRVQVFHENGQPLYQIGGIGQNDIFFDPTGLAVDAQDNIYVADFDRILVFNKIGVFLYEFGMHGSENGQFDRPTALAIDQNGRLIVADGFNHRIQVFTTQGEFLFAFSKLGIGPGRVEHSMGITTDRQNRILVADGLNNRVSIFDAQGQFLFQFGRLGNRQGEFDFPSGIETDEQGQIYVADSRNHRIQVFSPEGEFRYQWGSFGSDQGKFNFCNDIAFDHRGRILVSEADNHRIQMFDRWANIGTIVKSTPTLQLAQNYPNPVTNTTTITFSIPTTTQVSLRLLDLLGQEVQVLVAETLHQGRYQTPVDACHLPTGVYVYELRAGQEIQTQRLTVIGEH